MELAAAYLCPIRGLIGGQPPDPGHLARTAKALADLGLTRFILPIPEEPLAQSGRKLTGYLDGLIQALDGAAEAGVSVWPAPLAWRIGPLSLTVPDLVKPTRSAAAPPAFFAGKLRRCQPLDWWSDARLIQTRLGRLKELVAALTGHPALIGWLILDREADRVRPTVEQFTFVFKAVEAEIRERDEKSDLVLGVAANQLLRPAALDPIIGAIDRLRLAGLDTPPRGIDYTRPADGLGAAAYFARLANWLWEIDVEVEPPTPGDPGKGLEDDLVRGAGLLAQSGAGGMCWPSPAEPEPGRRDEPPWGLAPEMVEAALLNNRLEPKDWAIKLYDTIGSSEPDPRAREFIDLDRDEFKDRPGLHLARLWDHFRSIG